MPRIRDLDVDYPKRVSMKRSMNSLEWSYYHRGGVIYHLIYTYRDRLLLKSLGKNVDDVFSHYCKKFSRCNIPEYKEIFWDAVTSKYKSYWCNNFYLDGKIIKMYECKSRYKEKPLIVGGYTKKLVGANFDYWFKNTEALKVIYKHLNWSLDKTFELGELHSVIEELTFHYRQHPELWRPYKDTDKDIEVVYPEQFKESLKYYILKPKDFIINGEEIPYRSAKYRKIKAEEQKAKRKEYRNIRGKNKDYLDYILWERKKTRNLHQEQDIIDRDRLGFNEDSFRGEFYHGQKRKKKK